MNAVKRWLAVLIVLAVAIVAHALPAQAYCLDDPTSSYQFIDGSAVCAYSGGGCSACFVAGPRGGGSWDVCYYDWTSGDLTCHYFQ